MGTNLAGAKLVNTNLRNITLSYANINGAETLRGDDE
ncbi:MAG: pentapeptide repeat-containing protein [Nitrospinae bacterium]|nr:pentapeptide repeat-containing protein [Nitrospinota bacterium]